MLGAAAAGIRSGRPKLSHVAVLCDEETYV